MAPVALPPPSRGEPWRGVVRYLQCGSSHPRHFPSLPDEGKRRAVWLLVLSRSATYFISIEVQQ